MKTIASFGLKMLNKIIKLLRLTGHFRKTKTIVLALAIYSTQYPVQPIYYLHTIVFSLLMLSFSFIINDYFDRSYDNAIGKRRPISDLPEWQAVGLVVGLFLATYFYYKFFINNSAWWWIEIAIAIAAFYSMPPFRFKTKGFLGVIVASLCQEPIIFLVLIFGFAVSHDSVLITYFALTLFIRGLHGGIVHQIYDRTNDLRAGIRTWVNQASNRKILLVGRFILALFGISLLLLLPIGYGLNRISDILLVSILWIPIIYGQLYIDKEKKTLFTRREIV